MKHSDQSVVSVFGANDPPEGDMAYEVARATGKALAEQGYDLANGGYGGTMEASARGAKEAGGRTIGVVCSLWGSQPNRYIDRVIVTQSLAERVSRLIELGRGGYVVLPGATGTLVELATAWELISKSILGSRPLVCVGAFWQPLVEMMASVRPATRACVAVVEAPRQLGEHFAAAAGG